jgi:hypothetical protein
VGEKGNLEPATVAEAAAGGRSTASAVVDVASDAGGKLSDAVIAEAAGAGVGAAAERLAKDEDDGVRDAGTGDGPGRD